MFEMESTTYNHTFQSSDTETFYGKEALVYGWGTTSSGGAASDVLLEVRYVIMYLHYLEVRYLHYIQVAVPVVTPEQCATTMGPMEEGMICAGGVAGEDSCQVGR